LHRVAVESFDDGQKPFGARDIKRACRKHEVDLGVDIEEYRLHTCFKFSRVRSTNSLSSLLSRTSYGSASSSFLKAGDKARRDSAAYARVVCRSGSGSTSSPPSRIGRSSGRPRLHSPERATTS